MNISQLLSSFNFQSLGAKLMGGGHLGKTDLGVLKVALMVAALDGEVSEAEYKTFDALAKTCRGYTPENAAKALDEALHAAGYLLLLSSRVTNEELVKAFIREAKAALPNGFAYYSVEDVRRAMAMWVAVGMSDGAYSPRERMCIEELRLNFAEINVNETMREEERWLLLSPNLRQSLPQESGTKSVVSPDFVSRVENLIAQYGDQSDGERLLAELIGAEGAETSSAQK